MTGSTGHVFHPGHDAWHGQTVVVYTHGARTVIGRWDAIVGEHVQMRDAAVHEQREGAEARDAWVAKIKQFGVPTDHATYAFPSTEVERVVRLRDA